MNHNTIKWILSLALGTMLCVSVSAQNAKFQEGIKYYNNYQYTAAKACFEEMAAAGHVAATYNLGMLYFNGHDVAKNEAKAVEYWQRAAEQGNLNALNELAYCYKNGWGGLVADSVKAAELWLKAADQGHTVAQYNVGYSYLYGDGMKKDEKKASDYLIKAAVKGDANAQFELGRLFYIKKQYDLAVENLQKSADQGDHYAQTLLGDCYINGNGVKKNAEEAVKYYRKAALQGNTDSQYQLGLCYYNGDGIEKDYNLAYTWFDKAAKKYHSDALYYVALCYEKGHGVKKNRMEALECYYKAAGQGHEKAQKALKKWPKRKK